MNKKYSTLLGSTPRFFGFAEQNEFPLGKFKKNCAWKRAEDEPSGDGRSLFPFAKNALFEGIFPNGVVGVTGLEPTTSCSQSRRATSCATPRKYSINSNIRKYVFLTFVLYTADLTMSRVF